MTFFWQGAVLGTEMMKAPRGRSGAPFFAFFPTLVVLAI